MIFCKKCKLLVQDSFDVTLANHLHYDCAPDVRNAPYPDLIKCLSDTCSGTEKDLVYIDDDLLHVIQLFVNNNVELLFSCSGHAHVTSCCPYIVIKISECHDIDYNTHVESIIQAHIKEYQDFNLKDINIPVTDYYSDMFTLQVNSFNNESHIGIDIRLIYKEKFESYESQIRDVERFLFLQLFHNIEFTTRLFIVLDCIFNDIKNKRS